MCILPLPGSNCCPDVHAPMQFYVDLSFLERPCCLQLGFLTPWRPVGFVRCLSPNARPLQAPRSTKSLVGSFRAKVLLRRASLARRVTSIPAAPNSCRGPQFPWVLISLKMFLLRHATASQRDTFLQAATNFLREPQSPRVSFVGFTRRPAAIRRPLGRFFVTLEDFTAAFSVGTSQRSAPDSNSIGPCSSHSRLATAAPSLGISCRSVTFSLRSWIFSSRSNRMEWTMASIR
jgi:hypothetical protein